MKRVAFLMGISVTVLSFAYGQHLQGQDTFADVGTGFGCLGGGNGISYCQWLTVRGEREMPPRTGANARIRQIRVAESGEPFGRVLLLWSGWARDPVPDSGYWLKGIEWSSPIYEAAHVGDTFFFQDNTFSIYLWNDNYLFGRYRAAQASVYVESAPRPHRSNASENPLWNMNHYRSRDLLPSRPGVQLDPCYNRPRCGDTCSPYGISFSTGHQGVFRPQVLMKRITGLDQFVDESYSSLFRDVVNLSAVLRINGQAVQSRVQEVAYAPGEWGSRSMLLSGSSALRGSRGTYHVEYDVKMIHKPYDKNGNLIWIEPQLTPVEYLRQADRVYFDLRYLYYRAWGAYDREGSYTDGELPPVCIPKQPDTLQIQLNLQDFGLPYDYTVTLGGVALDDSTVEWSADEMPNRCVNIEGIDVLIYRVWGRLRTRLQLVPNQNNCGRSFNLVLTPIDGDDGNQLNGELYALCQPQNYAKINVEVRQIDYIAQSGNPNATIPNNPHLLYSFYDAEDIEFMLYGDANSDGRVDDADLILVLFEYGREGLSLNGDVNGDGRVDDQDILVVLLQFGRGYGECCRPCDEW